MKLSVLISTIDDGINNIKNIILQKRNDVEYVVSHQYTDVKYRFIPKELLRDDILVSQIPGKGLSKSRNNAIKHATGDIAVIADDDVRYKSEYFDTIIETYHENDIDIACFKIKTPDDELEYKEYPNETVLIKDFESYSPSSIELTFKIEKIQSHNIFFDQRFGLGAKFIGGEEKLFLYDSIKKDLKIKFFPLFVVEHPYESSNKILENFDINRIKINAAFDCRINGLKSIIRAILGPIINSRFLLKNNINPVVYSYHRISAILYIYFTHNLR